MPRYRLAIFDFDGTLADSAPWFAAALAEIADQHGLPRFAPDELARMRGLPTRAVLAAFGLPLRRVPAVAAHMRRLAERDAARIPLFPGAADMLDDLAAAGVELAVLTSNSETAVRRVLGPSAARIARFACGTALLGKGRRMARLIRRAGVAARDTVAIGDELRDLEAAAACGVAAGAVTWGYADPERLRAAGPAHLFTTPQAITAALR